MGCRGCERTFRCHIDRYEEESLDGLIGKRLNLVSRCNVLVDEMWCLESLWQFALRRR